jgi:hypothetical protein
VTTWLLVPLATACSACVLPIVLVVLLVTFVRRRRRRVRSRRLRTMSAAELAPGAWSLAEWCRQQLQVEGLECAALDAAIATRDLDALCRAWPEVSRRMTARARDLGDAEHQRRRNLAELIEELQRRARGAAPRGGS